MPVMKMATDSVATYPAGPEPEPDIPLAPPEDDLPLESFDHEAVVVPGQRPGPTEPLPAS